MAQEIRPFQFSIENAYFAVLMDAVRKPATYQDLIEVPDTLVAEIVAGELHTSPRPAARHAIAASVLGMDIGGAFQRGRGGPGGWWILYEPELHLGGDVLVPDLAGWRQSTMPEVEDVAFFTLAPDWVCEVLSPSTGRLDRIAKLPAYGREGIGHAWLVDPALRTLEIFENRDGQWVLLSAHANGDRFRARPFEEVEFELEALWAG